MLFDWKMAKWPLKCSSHVFHVMLSGAVCFPCLGDTLLSHIKVLKDVLVSSPFVIAVIRCLAKATLERKDLLICLQFRVQSIMAEKS